MNSHLQQSKIATAIRKAAPLLMLPLVAAIPQVQAQGDSPAMLEEVVVTALRRTEGTALMDTALSIDAMTGDELEARGFTSVMAALQNSPGVSVAKSGNVGDAVSIRGIGGIIGDSTTGYYLDDLPYTRISASVSPDLNPYDLDRVEVLRGPQGTLFGSGSLGGTVRVLTKNPIMDEFSGKATSGLYTTDGGGDHYKVQGAVNIPLVENKLAARLVASYIDEDGYIDLEPAGVKDYNTLEDTTYRAKLRWTPNDNWDVMASWWHSKRDTYQAFSDGDYVVTGGFIDLVTQTYSFVAPATPEYLNADTENNLYGLTVKYFADSFQVTSVTSYLDGEYISDFVVFGTSVTQGYPALDTFSQEIKFATVLDGDWNFTAGAIYTDMENEGVDTTGLWMQGFPDGPAVEFVRDAGIVTSESWAVFGESNYQINPEWELTVGLRYFYDERERFGEPTETLLELAGIDNPRDGDWDEVTGRINLAWRPDGNTLYFLNVAQGFRSGGLNPGTALLAQQALGVVIPETVAPDTVTSYELNGKWTLLEGNLNLEAGVYYMEWDDVQSFVTGATPDGTLVGWSDNVSEAEVLGAEFAVNYATGGLTLSASANYNDTEYKGGSAATGISAGDPITQAPEVTWAASATYIWSMDSLNGVAYLGANYVDERSDFSPSATAPGGRFVYESDEITIVNARIGVEADQWSVFLFGENLANEGGEHSALAALVELGNDPVHPRPLTYGVEVNFNF